MHRDIVAQRSREKEVDYSRDFHQAPMQMMTLDMFGGSNAAYRQRAMTGVVVPAPMAQSQGFRGDHGHKRQMWHAPEMAMKQEVIRISQR